MAVSEWVEVVGKLGPASVAAAVFLMNMSQNNWQKRVSARSARVEDEKLRLSLLDRRVKVIEALDDAHQHFHSKGGSSPEMVHGLYEALKIAELVYDDDEERAIQALLKKTVTWGQLDRTRALARHRNDEELQAIVDEMMEVETTIMLELGHIRKELLRATKVRAVPPITVKPWLRIKWR